MEGVMHAWSWRLDACVFCHGAALHDASVRDSHLTCKKGLEPSVECAKVAVLPSMALLAG